MTIEQVLFRDFIGWSISRNILQLLEKCTQISNCIFINEDRSIHKSDVEVQISLLESAI